MNDDDWNYHAPEPPPTKTIRQSICAIVLALVLGVGAVSLLLIHSVGSLVGERVLNAASLGSGMAAAYWLDKYLMVGYHVYVRLIVGVIIFFSVGVFIRGALSLHHI